MYVLTLASQKGGSGKTTLAGHLAVRAAQEGFGRVAVVDTDPQGSLSDWWNMRSQPTPEFIETEADGLARDVESLAGLGVDLLIVDTPPAITETIEHVVRLSDLVIVPTRPSPHDLRAAGATVDLVDRAGKPLVFVVNAGKMRARITSEAAIALSQHGTVAPTTIHQRNDFAASMIDGRTAMDLAGGSRSAREIAELWRYIAKRLKGERGTTDLAASPAPRKNPLTTARTEA